MECRSMDSFRNSQGLNRVPDSSKFFYSRIPASQQLAPHFTILALSLNPVHEVSELI
jgi:hypothetical protein